MSRIKKPRRPEARKYKSYDNTAMQRAIAEVNNGGSFKAVAKRFNINRTTLMNHVKGIKCKAVGRPTVLTHEEEEALVHMLVKLGDWGYGFDRLQLQRCVQDYLRRVDRQNPFKNGMPGPDWCMMFENRWATEISRRVAQNLPKNRAVAGSEEVMEDCFNKLKHVIERCNLTDKPQNVYNCDELGFQTDAGVQKVLCKKGSRNPHKIVGSVTKAMYTVLMCCNAIGDFLPMFINYKGLHLYSTWCVGGPDSARYNCSPSGWMEASQFFDWFLNCFIPEVSKHDGTKLLILDGHNSHVSVDLVEKAMENNIEIFCLPAHTSHIVQPLDVGVYKSVKSSWRQILRNFYQETGYKNVDKISFPSLMKKLSEYGCLSRANAIGGFEGAGIYPLNKEKMIKKKDIAEAAEGKVEINQTENEVVPVSEPTPTALGDQENETEVAGTSVSDSNEKVSVKKGLELAIMSVLQTQNANKSSPNKKSRITRKFAESLTENEVFERLKKIEEEKRLKMRKTQNKPIKQKGQKKAKKKVDENSSSSESDVSIELESEDEVDLPEFQLRNDANNSEDTQEPEIHETQNMRKSQRKVQNRMSENSISFESVISMQLEMEDEVDIPEFQLKKDAKKSKDSDEEPKTSVIDREHKKLYPKVGDWILAKYYTNKKPKHSMLAKSLKVKIKK